MPLNYPGSTGQFSTASDIGGGRQYTRLRGPVVIGHTTRDDFARTSTGGRAANMYAPPSVVNISTTPADISMTGGVALTSAMTVGYLYIPYTTGTGTASVVASSGVNFTAPSPPITSAAGVALCYDALNKRLMVYSTESGEWFAGNIFTCSSGVA